MEVPISLSYRWSLEELLLLNRLHMRCSPQLRKVRKSTRSGGIIFIVIGALCLCSIGQIPQPSERWRALAICLGLILLGVAFFVGPPMIMRRAAVKSYAQKPDREMLITYELTEERISSRSELGTSDLRWQGISRVVRTADGFLLYMTEMQILWLPVRGFANQDDIERLAELAKAKVADYEQER